MSKATIFKHKSRLPKVLFNKVVDYFIYSYNRMIIDEEQYSKQYCEENTTFHFEDYLKWKLVKKYLQDGQNKINSGIKEVSYLSFQFETEKEYIYNGIVHRDKIDIFISNLGLDTSWNREVKEDHYFAFECKRLKNNEKNNAYISDIEKFIQRDYWETGFRFPIYGLIAFVEKSSISINEIVSDIERKVLNYDRIHPIKNNNKIFTKCISNDFPYCKISKYNHNYVDIKIEIHHLFFDYSQIIID